MEHAVESAPLGRYRLIALLGQGGMADVYLACTQGPGGFQKLLVVKLARFTGEPMFSTMFLDEARIAAQLSHPNIVQTYEVGEEGSRHYIVMEYLDGANLARLRHRARKTGGVPLRFMVQSLAQVLEGLEYAHSARGIDGRPLQVVHRDLTPSNVIVTTHGEVKIVDFGIAKAVDTISFTQTGRYSGKVHYMPPEQLRAESIDGRADIFSLGAILAESVRGSRLWGDATGPMVASRLLNGDIPSLDDVPDVPAKLRQICAKALAPDRDKRYANAASFKADLLAVLPELGGAMTRDEMGQFVTKTVAEDRQRLQAVVDKQVARISHLKIGSQPAHDLPRLETVSAGEPTVEDHEIVIEKPPPESASLPSLIATPIPGTIPVPAIARTTSQSIPPIASLSANIQVPTLTNNSPSQPPTPVPQLAPRSRTPIYVLGGAAIAVGVVLIIVMSSGRGGEATHAADKAPVTQPAAPPPAAAAPIPAAPTTARIEVIVSPAAATISLDGKSLGTNPFVGSLPRDTQLHQLVVSAPGYASLTRTISMDQDVMLQLQLEEVKKPVPVPPAIVQVPSRPTSTPRPVVARPTQPAATPVRQPAVAQQPPPPTPPATPTPTTTEPNKRPIDNNALDGSNNKRAIDSNVFDDNSKKKPNLDRDNPWK